MDVDQQPVAVHVYNTSKDVVRSPGVLGICNPTYKLIDLDLEKVEQHILLFLMRPPVVSPYSIDSR